MALEEKKVIGMVTLRDDETIEIREDTIILRDGVEIARTFHRRVIEPDQDTATLPARIRRVSDACWTPDVVQAYRSRKAGKADK